MKVVDRPSRHIQHGGNHYERHKIQPWDVAEEYYSTEKIIGYHVTTANSYLMRHEEKGGIEDIRKAHHHLTALLEYLDSQKDSDESNNGHKQIYNCDMCDFRDKSINDNPCISCADCSSKEKLLIEKSSEMKNEMIKQKKAMEEFRLDKFEREKHY